MPCLDGLWQTNYRITHDKGQLSRVFFGEHAALVNANAFKSWLGATSRLRNLLATGAAMTPLIIASAIFKVDAIFTAPVQRRTVLVGVSGGKSAKS